MAGNDFYYHCMSRYQDLSLRTSESTSLQRLVGFSKDQVTELMGKLSFIHGISYSAHLRHSMRTKPVYRAYIQTGKQIAKLTSAERSRNATINATISDQIIPLLFVFHVLELTMEFKNRCSIRKYF